MPATKPLGQMEFTVLMASLSALVALAIDAMLPALKEIGADLGATGNDVQMIVTAIFIGSALGQLVSGTLSDVTRSAPCDHRLYRGLQPRHAPLHCLDGLQHDAGRAHTAGVWCGGPTGCRPRHDTRHTFRRPDGAHNVLCDEHLHHGAHRRPLDGAGRFVVLRVESDLHGLPDLRRNHLDLVLLSPTRNTAACAPRTRSHGPRSLATSPSSSPRPRPDRGTALVYALLLSVLIAYLRQRASDLPWKANGVGEAFPIYFAVLAAGIGAASILNGSLVMRFGMRRLTMLAVGMIVVTSTIFLAIASSYDCLPPFWAMMIYFAIVLACFGSTVGNITALALEPLGDRRRHGVDPVRRPRHLDRRADWRICGG